MATRHISDKTTTLYSVSSGRARRGFLIFRPQAAAVTIVGSLNVCGISGASRFVLVSMIAAC